VDYDLFIILLLKHFNFDHAKYNEGVMHVLFAAFTAVSACWFWCYSQYYTRYIAHLLFF